MKYDQSGVSLPEVTGRIQVRYFVTDCRGNVMSLRDRRGNTIENCFADEQGALDMAIHMAEQDDQFMAGGSLYLVQKGVVRKGVGIKAA